MPNVFKILLVLLLLSSCSIKITSTAFTIGDGEDYINSKSRIIIKKHSAKIDGIKVKDCQVTDSTIMWNNIKFKYNENF